MLVVFVSNKLRRFFTPQTLKTHRGGAARVRVRRAAECEPNPLHAALRKKKESIERTRQVDGTRRSVDRERLVLLII